MIAALFLIITKMLGFAVSCEVNFAVCIDASGSINDETFPKEIDFVAEFYTMLNDKVGGNFIPTMVVTFSSGNNVSINYTDKNSFEEVLDVINNDITHSKGATYTAYCMNLVQQSPRPNDHPTLHLVVTDGVAHDEDEIPEARNLLERDGFLIQAAGFGNINKEGLLIISGVEENTIYEPAVTDLGQHIEGLLNKICEQMYPCSNKPSVINAEPIGSECENVKLGFVCPVVCLPTYLKTKIDPVCVTGGVWKPEDICSAVCENGPTVVNGKENYTEICANKVEGDPCPVECIDGTFFFGKTAVCGSDHLWQTTPMCLVVVENDFKSTYWPILLLLIWFVIALIQSLLIVPAVVNKGPMAALAEDVPLPQPEVMDPEINISLE